MYGLEDTEPTKEELEEFDDMMMELRYSYEDICQ
jgi:hypothetical protein